MTVAHACIRLYGAFQLGFPYDNRIPQKGAHTVDSADINSQKRCRQEQHRRVKIIEQHQRYTD